MKKIIVALAVVAIMFSGCQPTTPDEVFNYKPSKYEVNSVDDTPIKIEVSCFGRSNPIGDYLSNDPVLVTLETVTPWEYAMMTCKDFYYFIKVENIDTVEVNLVSRVVIDDVTVAEQSGEWIDLTYQF